MLTGVRVRRAERKSIVGASQTYKMPLTLTDIRGCYNNVGDVFSGFRMGKYCAQQGFLIQRISFENLLFRCYVPLRPG